MKQSFEQNPIVHQREIEKLFHITPVTVRRWQSVNGLPLYKVRKQVYSFSTELVEWINSHLTDKQINSLSEWRVIRLDDIRETFKIKRDVSYKWVTECGLPAFIFLNRHYVFEKDFFNWLEQENNRSKSNGNLEAN